MMIINYTSQLCSCKLTPFTITITIQNKQPDALQSKLIDKCCQIGKDKAVESPKFNCKLSARDALLGDGGPLSSSPTISSHRLRLAADVLLSRDPNFADQCELVLESCCMAYHRTKNCDSGKQLAKSGASCMDVELSKEATIATESFNDCCMSCSLGILAAKNNGQNETSTSTRLNLASRCKLLSPLASSLSGQLYEQTYGECCQENLPRASGTLLEPGKFEMVEKKKNRFRREEPKYELTLNAVDPNRRTN